MSTKRTIYEVIGKNIRNYRIKHGYTQERLSELLSANPKFIGHVERVERYISLKKIIELSEIFKVNVKDFFE